MTQDSDVSGGAFSIALEHLDGGGLPCPVGPEKGDDLAGLDIEVNALNCLERTVRLAETTHADSRCGIRRATLLSTGRTNGIAGRTLEKH